jgi:hypothetical protein
MNKLLTATGATDNIPIPLGIGRRPEMGIPYFVGGVR